MNSKLKLTSVLLITFATVTGAFGASKETQPDFAFPKQVSQKAVKQLESAVKNNDSPNIVRSILNYGLAQSAVAEDNIPKVFRIIDETKGKTSNPEVLSMLSLVEARIYSDIYSASKYTFDKRKLPLTPYPEDYKEWSGQQFQNRISTLCSQALACAEVLQSIPIKEYSQVVTYNTMTPVYYPTLYDFVAYQTISLREKLSDYANMFALALMSPDNIFIIGPRYVPKSSEATKILDTYAELLKFHANDTAPFINADLNRLKFVNNGLYNIYDNPNHTYALRLKELYGKFSGSEYSGDILDAFPYIDESDTESYNWYYSALKHNIDIYPAYSRIGCLKNRLRAIEQKRLSIELPQAVYPGKGFAAKIKGKNIASCNIDIYRLPNTFLSQTYYNGNISALKRIATYAKTFVGDIPFSVNDTVQLKIEEPGYYIAVPSVPGISVQKRSYEIIYCSRLAVGTERLIDTEAYVVDPETGEPVEEAKIYAIERPRDKNGIRELGLTDSNGFLVINKYGGYRLFSEKGSDHYALPLYTYAYANNDVSSDSVVNAFTELPLYRPGDTLKFSAIYYNINGDKRKTMPNNTIYAALYNVNDELVDSTELNTDEFGRCHGQFLIPRGELTGYYVIRFNKSTRFSRYSTSAGEISVMVSDYKLPTYEITTDKPLLDTPQKGAVILRGSVKTYSGVPLSNQEVYITLGAAQNLWWRTGNNVEFFTDSVTTDTNGKWEIILPEKLFANSPAPGGYFTAKLTSVSPSGESQQTSVSFTRGAKYNINVAMKNNIDVTSHIKLNLSVTNSADENVDMPVAYTVIKQGEVIKNDTVPYNKTVDWSTLSGHFVVKFYLVQDTAVSESVEVNLYSPSDKLPPVDSPVWMPSDGETATVKDNASHKFLYGTTADKSYILYTLYTPDKIIERRWIEAHAGMHTLDVKLPDGVDKAHISMVSTVNMRTNDVSCSLVRDSSIRSLKLETESFRDKIIPGNTEIWSFRVVNERGSGIPAAVMLDMYTAAINAIQHPNWSLNPRSAYIRNLSRNMPLLDSEVNTYLSSDIRNSSECMPISPFMFNLYGRGFVQKLFIVNDTRRLYGAAAPTSMKNAFMTRTEGANIEEAADEAEAVEELSSAAGLADAGEAKAQSTEEVPFNYRDSNVVSALWRPMLATDNNGNLTISFTVPDANTTWQMFATAFDGELHNATLSRLIVANKPIMAQPNLPRFLRTGDKAVLSSLIINNSDSTVSASTFVEIFDPVTGKILNQSATTKLIQPGDKAIADIVVDTPVDSPFIGYRVKSSANGFADGEQSLIPVLPASTPVIETKPFYIAPDSIDFSMKLPAVPDSAKVTLQYCDNPLWYVVTALPGLAKDEPSTTIQAAYNLFSAATARGLLKKNPVIADALKYWAENNESDSTLVSMLDRNSDLKNVLLKATPWLADARSDSERMARLALLLDNKNIESVINNSVNCLKKLQCADGGLAWMGQYRESSLWATSEVLASLGRVNRLGFLPEDKELAGIITKAIDYVQTQQDQLYFKYPKADYFSYVTLRDAWPKHKLSAQSRAIVNATVQRTIAGWKKFGIGRKAEAAVMLFDHSYKSVASTILESLREYSEYKPEQGMWWPSTGDIYGGSPAQLQITADALEAFYLIQPGTEDVNRIRQWLILQKEAENWGNSAYTSDVVSSILLTSDSWITPSSEARIYVNDYLIKSDCAEKYSGYFRTPISNMNPSDATLKIERKGNTPAFGAVFCQYTQDMADVKAQSCDAVSIEKNVLKRFGTEYRYADSLSVGDKVQVLLTIHVNRDMQYVAITDDRPACFEPAEQLPAPIYSEGVYFYRENRDSSTNIFISNLPKGTYQLSYEMWVNNAGNFASGIASLQSQYAPQLNAHSSGNIITINAK